MLRAGATLRCGARASHCGGFSCCGAQALGTQASAVVARGLQYLWVVGSRAQTQQLWRTGLAAPRHAGSSRTRARTRVPCIGRWILNHCSTREGPALFFFSFFFLPSPPPQVSVSLLASLFSDFLCNSFGRRLFQLFKLFHSVSHLSTKNFLNGKKDLYDLLILMPRK